MIDEIMPEEYPHHKIPDACLLCPHHYLWGMYLALFAAVLSVHVERRRDGPTKLAKPVIYLGAVLLANFGWFYMWRHPGAWYHAYGPVLVMLGSGVAFGVSLTGWVTRLIQGDRGYTGAILWDDVPLHVSALAAVATFSMLDDALEHAFGIWTPLDQAYKAGVSGDLTASVAVVAVFVAFVVGSYLYERFVVASGD